MGYNAFMANKFTIPHNYEEGGPLFEEQYAKEKSPTAVSRLKIITYNIDFGERVDKAIEELTTIPALQNSDLLLLQEMDEKGVERIAKALQYNYIYYPASIHKHGKNFGNAILSPWPIRQPYKLLLPHYSLTIQQRRIAARAMVDVGTVNVLVYNAHTETYLSTRQHRRDQTATVLNDIDPAQAHVIVAGDFNTVRKATTLRIDKVAAKHGLTRATAGVGATVHRFPAIADHIYMRGFSVVAAGKAEETAASDHLPVWAMLSFD